MDFSVQFFLFDRGNALVQLVDQLFIAFLDNDAVAFLGERLADDLEFIAVLFFLESKMRLDESEGDR